jgi:hypothetical protein
MAQVSEARRQGDVIKGPGPIAKLRASVLDTEPADVLARGTMVVAAKRTGHVRLVYANRGGNLGQGDVLGEPVM